MRPVRIRKWMNSRTNILRLIMQNYKGKSRGEEGGGGEDILGRRTSALPAFFLICNVPLCRQLLPRAKGSSKRYSQRGSLGKTTSVLASVMTIVSSLLRSNYVIGFHALQAQSTVHPLKRRVVNVRRFNWKFIIDRLNTHRKDIKKEKTISSEFPLFLASISLFLTFLLKSESSSCLFTSKPASQVIFCQFQI